jgi:hypothetical protein
MTSILMRCGIALFASLLVIPHDIPAQSKANNTFYAESSSELGAQITSAIDSGSTSIKLAPGTTYTMTTQVTNAGPGTFIDCQGSTIAASYNIGALFEWQGNAKLQLSDWVHPPTGIAHCKFVPASKPTGITTMHVGYVAGIAQFTATDITVEYGGAFEVNGPSITGSYTGIRVVDPTTPSVWLFELAHAPSNWYGPNGNQIDDSYCEGGLDSGFVNPREICFDVEAGSVNISKTYLEAFGTGVLVDGGGVSIQSSTFNMRSFPAIAVQYNSGSLNISSSGIRFADGSGNVDTGILFNNPTPSTVNLSNLGISYASTTQLSSVFMANYPVRLNLSGSSYTSASFAGNAILFGISGKGTYDQSNITGFNVSPALNMTTWWCTPSAGGDVFTDGVIMGNTFSNVTNIKGLAGTAYVGNSHPNNAPTIIFTRRGTFVGNTFPKGVKSLTLAGSPDVGNTD